jgi:hypothetical protein
VVCLAGGAATRDEFFEPFTPPFAAAVWADDAAAKLKIETGHTYNERTDLPRIKPMGFATFGTNPADRLPVLGLKGELRQGGKSEVLGSFDDHSPAAGRAAYGRGQVTGFAFLPALAYGRLAGFKPRTLEEKWPEAPRRLLAMPLREGKITPVAAAGVPVVETSLLKSPKGSAVVLVNYTYQPIKSLKVTLRGVGPVKEAVSTEGVAVKMRKVNDKDVELELPLEWTDIVLLRP